MPSRVPTTSDFPAHLQFHITLPPPSAPRATNVIILLHGLGDTLTPFINLAEQLNLPETTCLALQAPIPLPFDLGGFYWSDELTFDQVSGAMDPDSGFDKVLKMIGRDIIQEGLIGGCGYTLREIMLFGLGQGGMAALAVAASMSEDELGGIVSLGGPLPASCLGVRDVKTPILVLGGSSASMITRTALESLRKTCKRVEYHKWKRVGDGMPRNREEMLPIMRFFSRRLRSQSGVPEGSVEVG